MAETVIQRSSSIVRNATPGATSGRPHATVSGQHKVVSVTMGANGPQVNNSGQQARSGVTILPPKGGTRNFTTGGLPNQGAKSSVTVFPPKDPKYAGTANAIAAAAESSITPMTTDQLMFLRHLADNYVKEAKTAAGEAELTEAVAENVKLAEKTILDLDAQMAEITAAAAAATAAATAAAAAAAVAAARPAPAPRAVAVGSRQVAASATPRRVARPAGTPPPPVVVKMEGKVPVQQAPAASPVPQATIETAPTEGDVAQGKIA